MGYKDPNKQREYQRVWMNNKRAGNVTRTTLVTKKLTHEEVKLRQKRCQNEYNNKVRAKADELFGTSCFFCGKTAALALHKKDGQRHNDSLTARYAIEAPQEWVRLCIFCHKIVHWNMGHLGMSWEEIVSRL